MVVSVATEVKPAVPAIKSPRIRLDYLDSIRALAALYVVFYHAFWFTIGQNIHHYAKPIRILFALFMYGHYAVDVFIVLSGYCIMLPVVRSADQKISHGLIGFIQRRAKRILPPYYAAVVVSLLISEILSHIHRATNSNETFTTTGLVTHFLLIHDLSAKTALQLNPVMWSVAVEWQIYFVFALLLLPIWRRIGSVALILGSLALTFPLSLLHNSWASTIQNACPWYIGLFGLGMAAASINFSVGNSIDRLRKIVSNRWYPIYLIVVTIVLAPLLRAQKNEFVDDVLVGLLTSAFLVYVTNTILVGSSRLWSVRLLESKQLVFIGTFSYSIYLFHLPLLDLMRALTPRTLYSHQVFLFAITSIQIIIALAASYGFYQLVEKRFQNMPKSHIR